jgi:hypothetical protein
MKLTEISGTNEEEINELATPIITRILETYVEV